MKNNLTTKERVDKAMRKAIETNEYDYIGIAKDNAMAALCSLGMSKVKNMFLIVKNDVFCKHWVIENYQVKECPDILYLCVKNPKVLFGCLGDCREEKSFFIYKEQEEDWFMKKTIIFGAIEISECACVFYFDGRDQSSNYVYQYTIEQDTSQLFKLCNKLYKLEEEQNASRIADDTGSEREKYASIHGEWNI